MLTEKWPPCIITAFDLVGTRSLASTGRGSSQMIEMHRFTVTTINLGLPMHSHGYVWNDSVLLLSYQTKPANVRRRLLAELSDFKQSLEAHCGVQTYAISVKGLAFPPDPLAPAIFEGQIAEQSRAVVLKTSSWAMANCFLIEKTLGKNRADWYIDSRIATGTGLPDPVASERIALLPKNEPRTIHMYNGYLRFLG